MVKKAIKNKNKNHEKEIEDDEENVDIDSENNFEETVKSTSDNKNNSTLEFKNKKDKENKFDDKINKKEINKVMKNKFNNNENYIKRMLKFLLIEYSGAGGTSFLDIVYSILKLKNIKIVYYLFLSLYNYFLDKNKAIASIVLLCISLLSN